MAQTDVRSRGVSLSIEGCSSAAAAAARPGTETRPVTPERILDVSYAFWKSKALLSAVELNLFTVLADGPMDCDMLLARLKLHGRGARDFFDALVALGFLLRDGKGNYSNTPDADYFLNKCKPTYIGGLLEHLNARHYQNWGLLTEALRTGMPQSGALGTGSYPGLYVDSSSRELFLNGMTAGSLIAAKTLTARFTWHQYKTVVDVGTAQGCVPVQIASVHPHLTGGGFDLPQVEPVFKSYVQQHGLADRLQFFAGDFFTDPLPGADVLVMGRILHNWDVSTRKLLLQKAYKALPSGGVLIIYDPLIEDSRTHEAHGLLSSLNMLIETTAGSEYTETECTNWMREAGFLEIRTEPLGDVHTAVIGTKRE